MATPKSTSLLKREWRYFGDRRCPERSVTVIQWNVLADALTASSPTSNFCRAPPQALLWEHRKVLMLEEIRRSGADVLCLEEVDHFHDFLVPELSKLGYTGHFISKPDSVCLKFPDNNGPDGCAIFYRSNFSLLEKKEIILKNTNGENSNQVALMLLLQFHGNKTPPSASDCQESGDFTLCVAVTHLKAKNNPELRLAQGRHLTAEVAAFAKESRSPVIICGDFNATPQEPVYQHMCSGSDMKLKSAYAGTAGAVSEDQETKAEPPFTSCKVRPEKECWYTIDYVWYGAGGGEADDGIRPLEVRGVWSLPAREEIGEDALPSVMYPSDHLALCVNFHLPINEKQVA